MEAELGLATKRKRTVEPAYGPSPSLKATGVKPGQVNYGPPANDTYRPQPSVGLSAPAPAAGSYSTMAMGPPGQRQPGPGLAFPGTPGTPPGAGNPIDPNALGLGPLSKQLLSGGHPITSAQPQAAQYGVPSRTVGGRGAAGMIADRPAPDVNALHAQNPDGRWFGGATPGTVYDSSGAGRPGFLAQQAPEGGPVIRNINPNAISPGAQSLAADDPKRMQEESRVLGLADTRVAGMGPNQKAAYDARMITRGQNREPDRPSDLALANKKSYQDRRTAAATERKTALGGLNANQFRAKQRADAENASADRLFADKHPDAAARMKLGQGQLAQAGQQAKDMNLFRKDQMASNEKIQEGRNNATAQAGKDKISAAAIAAGQKDPFAPAPEKKQYTDDDYRSMSSEDAVKHMQENGLTPSEINKRMSGIHGGLDHNWHQYPGGPWFGINTPVQQGDIPSSGATPGASNPAPKTSRPKRKNTIPEDASERYGIRSGYAF